MRVEVDIIPIIRSNCSASCRFSGIMAETVDLFDLPVQARKN